MKCPRCGTQYLEPVAECDWCPGIALKPEGYIHATEAEKARAFEWLRAEALKLGNPNWRHAAIMLQEIVEHVFEDGAPANA